MATRTSVDRPTRVLLAPLRMTRLARSLPRHRPPHDPYVPAPPVRRPPQSSRPRRGRRRRDCGRVARCVALALRRRGPHAGGDAAPAPAASRHGCRDRPRARYPAPRVRPPRRGRARSSTTCRPSGSARRSGPRRRRHPAGRRRGRDIGLGGSRTMLVEFGFELRGTHTEVVQAALAAGRGIVIAHPERYHYPGRAQAARRDASLAGDGRAAAGERGKLHRTLPGSPPRVGVDRVGDGGGGIGGHRGDRPPRSAADRRLAAGGVRRAAAPAASRRWRSGRWWSGRPRCCGTKSGRGARPRRQIARGRRVAPIAWSR